LKEILVIQAFKKLFYSGVAAAAALSAAVATAAAPTPTDPTNNAMGLLPGTFPTTVTAANITVEQGTPATMNGTNQNLMRVSYVASGPVKWTHSRANEGDLSFLIGPGNPNDHSYFPSFDFKDNYGPITNGPFEKSTIAWRINQQTGAALATVRHNGVDYGLNYTNGGFPVGRVHGIAYFNASGSGWGYRMNDGVFANGISGSADLQMGYAGFDNDLGEGSSNVAAAYFPYEQGWKGAWVNSGENGEGTFAASSPGLPASSVNWANFNAYVVLPGVNSATDGMLFVAPTNDDNSTNIAAASPNAGGWTVSVREDFDNDLSGQTVAGANSFQFLYVPYSAPRLIGGHVQGGSASLIHSSNDAFFDVSRTSTGKYALSVYGSNGVTKLSENDGTLIMSVASSVPGNPSLADRKFLSYQYNSGTGNFEIESRELVGINSPNSENQFGDDLALRDVNFYFAWVSFTNPLAPGLNGDYNSDGAVNAADYVVWRNAGATDTLPNDPTPGTVNQADYLLWRANFGSTASLGAGVGSGQSIPEPAAGLLLSLALALFYQAMPRSRRALAATFGLH
jgi:hypothetical protein